MFRIDLSLSNTELYAGCEIEQVAGRPNLKTPVVNAVAVLGVNVRSLLTTATPAERQDGIVLTGPMAVWSYLVVFHAVVHMFSRVYYDDGRNGPVLIASHG